MNKTTFKLYYRTMSYDTFHLTQQYLIYNPNCNLNSVKKDDQIFQENLPLTSILIGHGSFPVHFDCIMRKAEEMKN